MRPTNATGRSVHAVRQRRTENDNDINISYEGHGSGQPVVVIHGNIGWPHPQECNRALLAVRGQDTDGSAGLEHELCERPGRA
jgi:hypothetical protein